jgi:hypothetical protein
MGIGMSLAKTSIPLLPLQINTLGCRFILDLLVKVADLGTLGSRIQGMQSWGIVIKDEPPNIGTSFPGSKDIGQGQGNKSDDFGELHFVTNEGGIGVRVLGCGPWVVSRDIQERHGVAKISDAGIDRHLDLTPRSRGVR